MKIQLSRLDNLSIKVYNEWQIETMNNIIFKEYILHLPTGEYKARFEDCTGRSLFLFQSDFEKNVEKLSDNSSSPEKIRRDWPKRIRPKI